VTRYLLDTNIISNATKPKPSQALVRWMADQMDEDLFIASLTLAEIRRGILEKSKGKERNEGNWRAGSLVPKGRESCSRGACAHSTRQLPWLGRS
jgi:toxin FitB